MVTGLSLGTVAAGELDLTIDPKYPPTPKQQGVMFIHGAGSNATYCISPLGNQDTLTRLIAVDGYSARSGDIGGPQTWGNPTAMSRITSMYNALQSSGKVATGKVALVSASMGGLSSMNWAAANPDKVSCIVSVIPVCNVTDIRNNNRDGYGSLIDAAYPGGWSEATYGENYNPYTYSQMGKLAGIPILFFYGEVDTLCLPEFPVAMAQHPGNNIQLVPLPYGHDYDSYAAVNQPQIVEFLNTYNLPTPE